MDDTTPISYLALPVGTPVLSTSGTTIGTVEHVLQIPEEDLFDGIVLKVGKDLRFVDRDQIAGMTAAAVRTTISDAEAADLPQPQGTEVFRADGLQDTGASLTARFGRLFGRERWTRQP